MPNYLDVGKIVNTHGIKGEVRVESLTDDPKTRYAKGSKLVIKLEADEYAHVIVNTHRVHKSFDLLTFEGYSSINDVEKFKGKMLKIDEDLLPELEGDQYYTSQIIGAKVIDENKVEIGQLKEILFLPANDVWVVARPGKSDLLLPNIQSVILDVDVQEQVITVHVLEGLDEDEN